ncbi:cytochrome c oxidase assembly protein [Motiliproteus coralliicola]|uniref:Cytochrome c oxidase assembly protein CtaG n=1 Tax=Motiliproteus coralliicola TaxID=2283196 RepID=A0A369WQZ2_9GAMM|nr:cytochrome c oxidase assembly protein [Motiliproteus coralliicola]RDE24518.1 cytochrome c oxidase assembly protein [Motiliproteus coralliicola]
MATPQSPRPPDRRDPARLARRLLLVAVLMFGFGFALAPLYDVFCELTGINGKVTRTGEPAQPFAIDRTRLVRVQLIAVNNEGMPWQFQPEQPELSVYPGEQAMTSYLAMNPTTREMVARAVPSVAPAEAAGYLQKVNCFCFESQSLGPNMRQTMPLVLMIDPDLPEHIRTITLSYTLFDATAGSDARLSQRRLESEPAAGARSTL